MDMFDGFVFLEEKKKSLIPILCQYDFLSALTAAFSITSWRKNRGAQESCLALNSAMVENTEWGRKTIFTPNDLEEFSSEVSQIAEFDSDEKNSESQVLSWGGASDYFTVFLSEKGFISKGAIEYSNVYSEVDTSAAHIFSHYLELGGVFPFHLSSTIFADPECWNVICDDNSVYQFTRKVKALPGGALFKYDNGCSVFFS